MKAITKYALKLFILVSLNTNWISSDEVNITKRGYILTAPSEFDSNSTETVCLTLQGIKNDGQITLNLTSIPSGQLIAHSIQDIKNGTGKCFQLEVSPTSDLEASVNIRGAFDEDDYSINNTKTAKIRQPNDITLIQTDKPVYKPGQNIQFRIVRVTSRFLPSDKLIRSIWIENPSQVRLAQWISPLSKNGITDLNFQLSEEPQLGTWTISSEDQTKNLVKQTFRVEEYVLPKFSVKITPPSVILANFKEFTWKVCAHYTYGEPVIGRLRVNITRASNRRWVRPFDNNSQPVIIKQSEFKECQTMTVNREHLLKVGDHMGFYNILHFYAEVTEHGTETTMSDYTVKNIEKTPLKLSFLSKKYFKPGLAYTGQVKAENKDGTPAENERISIEFSTVVNGEHEINPLITNSDGIVEFTIPPQSKTTERINLKIKATNYQTHIFTPGRFLDRNYNSRSGRYGGSHGYPWFDTEYFVQPALFESLKSWHSKSNSYIQIERIIHPLRCNEQLDVKVYFTQLNQTEAIYSDLIIHYQIISRNDAQIQLSKIIKMYNGLILVSNDTSFTIPITIDPSMSPKVHLLVYYIREDGEIVSDSETFDVDECFSNKIEMKFGEEKVLPGAPASLHLSADKKSLCAIGVIDKSVHLLSSHEFNSHKVFSIINSQPSNTMHSSWEPICPRKGTWDNIQIMPTISLVELIGLTVWSGPDPIKFAWRTTNGRSGAAWQNNPLCGIASEATLYEYTKYYKIHCEIFANVEKCCPTAAIRSTTTKFYRYWWEGLNRTGKSITFASDTVTHKNGKGYYEANNNLFGSQTAFDSTGMLTMTDLTLDSIFCSRQQYRRMQYYDMPGPPGNPTPLSVSSLLPIPEFRAQSGSRRGSSRSRGRSRGNAPSAPEISVDHTETALPAVEVREHFPETWLWELLSIGDDGQLSMQRNTPHTVTEWTGSSFCVSPESGLGMSSQASIKAFQPFFLSYTMPYSVKNGETIPLTVSIFNYLSGCFPVAVTLEPNKAFKIQNNSTEVKHCLCGNKSYSHKYHIQPLEIGNINITVRAHSISIANSQLCDNHTGISNVVAYDAITKPLLVKAQGFPHERTQSNWICTEDYPEKSKTFEYMLELPSDVIEGSARASLSVTGDLLGPTVSGLENLVKLPTGCGEQNMVKFVPNIYVLHYLNATQQLSPTIKAKAISHLKTGYQRELNYKRDDGSYSAFGKSDSEGSIWLTAFVIKSFAQAQSSIYIDQQEIQAGIQFIVNNQLENGCFKSTGRLLDKSLQGGVRHDKTSLQALTMYITIALLEAGFDPSNKVIKQAFQCIEKDTQSDIFQLAMKTYATVLANKTDSAKRLLKTLEQRAIKNGNTAYWSNNQSQANEIETTSYVLLAMVTLNSQENKEMALKVVRWLTKQRNAYGGFHSTQDTVLALQALEKYTSSISKNRVNLTIGIEANDLDEIIHVNNENRLLQQSKSIPVLPNMIDATVSGDGCALVQILLKYNTPESQTSATFYLDVSISPYDLKTHSRAKQTIEICTSYQGPDVHSNMAIVEVQMVTGYEADSSQLEKMKNSETKLKRWEIANDGTVELYFDELTKDKKCFNVIVTEKLEVDDRKPANIKVYDYYQPEQSKSKEYLLLNKAKNQSTVTDPHLAPQGNNETQPLATGDEMQSDAAPFTCPICRNSLSEELKAELCFAKTVLIAKIQNTTTKIIRLLKNVPSNASLTERFNYKMSPTCKCTPIFNGNKIFIVDLKNKINPKSWTNVEFGQRYIIITMDQPTTNFINTMNSGCVSSRRI